MNYTEHEQKVLLHFFTNIDSDVYCAKDSMPNELWALLEGGYSRSELPMRERFLQIFKDISLEMDVTYPNIIANISNDVNNPSNCFMNEALKKASKFMAKWAVDYGHNSLKDSSIDRIAIENISIKASKELENTSLGAFQEKSTRYMDFSKDNFFIPNISELSEELQSEAITSVKESMELYRESLALVTDYYKSVIKLSDFKTEAAWLRTCKAKAFDEVRYLLPTCIKTSLGVTIPSRETERWISKLLASPYDEVRSLAAQIKDECCKINPSLITHVKANSYLSKINSKLSDEINSYFVESGEYPLNKVTLKVSPTNIETDVVVNALLETGCSLETAIKYLDHIDDDIDTKEYFFKELFSERGSHDEAPSCLETGSLHYTIMVDIGAYRDLQRHRVGKQTCTLWTGEYGYSIPDVLENDSLKFLKEKYITHLNKVQEIVKNIRKEDRFLAEYFAVLGFNVVWTYSSNLKQMIYLIELRSGESGHYSYRRIAQEMFKELEPYIPNISKYVRVNMKDYTDRRKAEEIIQEKIKKAKEK